MLFSALLKEISADIPINIVNCDDSYQIDDVALIDSASMVFDNSTLYFGYTEQLSASNLPDHCILAGDPHLFADKRPAVSDQFQGISSSDVVKTTADLCTVPAEYLFRLFNAAKHCIDESHNHGFYGELMECAARSGSIDFLINLAASKLGNTVILLNTDFKILSYSTVFEVTDPLWSENIAQGYCTYEFISAVQQLDAVKNAAQTSDPVVVTCYASPLRKLSSKIYQNGTLIGIVLMLECETPISPTHMKLLPIISAAVRDSVGRYAPYLIPSKSDYQKLLYDLLIGAGKEELASRASRLSFPPHMCALCITQSRYLGQEHLTKTAAEELTRCIPNVHLTFHEKGIAALVPLGDLPKLPEETFRQLEMLAEKEHLRIGISNLFFDPLTFARRYRQAKQTLKLCEQLKSPNLVNYYSDWAFYDLLMHSTADSPGLFCHPALAILNRYDHSNKSDLYHTLRTYLECDCCIKDTAARLFIHRNSLNYRLERIHELTQVDLTDGNTRFLLSMSYRIDHFTRLDE